MSPSVEPFNEAKYKALMDGLDIKEYKFSEVVQATDYFRLEADYFTAQNLHGDNIVSAIKYIERVQYGTSEFLNEEKQGYPILRLNEFETYFIKEPAKYCNIITRQQYEELKLHKGDVLVCRTNGNPDLVGRAAVIMEECDYAFASYLFRVNVSDEITPECFAAYLQSKYGRIEIDKNSMKGNQTNFSPAKLKDIKIPSFSYDFCKAITCRFRESYDQLKTSKDFYSLAEKLLKDKLSINFDDKQSISIKKLSNSFNASGRLDAEYYQPKYEKIETAIKNIKHTNLDVICDVETGEFISETLYGKEGFSYIRGTDITSHCIDVENATKVNTTIKGLNVIENGDLAFAMIGSVGNVSINRGTTAIVSNNLGTIKPHDKKLSNYLLVYLLSDIGQALFEKYQTRTAQPKIKKEDVGKFLVPLLSDDEIEFISNKAEESFRLKEKSKELLDIAIKAVEMAIETNEDSALLWLETQML